MRNEEGGNSVATFILRGSNDSILDDLERVVDDGVNTYRVYLRMKTEWENTGKFRFRFLYFSDHFRIFGKIRKRDENGTVGRGNGTGNGSIRIPTVFGIHGKIRNIPGFYPGFSRFSFFFKKHIWTSGPSGFSDFFPGLQGPSGLDKI